MLIDSISKTSYLDVILLNSSSTKSISESLFNNVMSDLLTQTNTTFFALSPLLQSEYQETFSTTLLVSPELSMVFSDYVTTY
jgi:hypothetical protein